MAHNPRIALAKYAVRGALPQRASNIAKRMSSSNSSGKLVSENALFSKLNICIEYP